MAKVDLITGFLGSGKTTFIIKYVKYLLQLGLKVGIIENDYGAINVDMLILDKELGEKCGLEMVVAGDLDCRKRRLRTKLIAMGMEKYDRVIVEPSGIFDPDEFFDMLHEETLERWYEIGSVIAVVDAGLEDEIGKESDYILVSQVAGAKKTVFSKTQLYSEQELKNTIEHINRAMKINRCDKRIEYGSDAYLAKNWEELDNRDFEDIMNSGYDVSDYVKKRVMEDNEYNSLFFFNVEKNIEDTKSIIEHIFENNEFGKIIRIKGFVKKDEEEWYSINYTKNEHLVEISDKGQEVIIVIGENLNKEKLEKIINNK